MVLLRDYVLLLACHQVHLFFTVSKEENEVTPGRGAEEQLEDKEKEEIDENEKKEADWTREKEEHYKVVGNTALHSN